MAVPAVTCKAALYPIHTQVIYTQWFCNSNMSRFLKFQLIKPCSCAVMFFFSLTFYSCTNSFISELYKFIKILVFESTFNTEISLYHEWFHQLSVHWVWSVPTSMSTILSWLICVWSWKVKAKWSACEKVNAMFQVHSSIYLSVPPVPCLMRISHWQLTTTEILNYPFQHSVCSGCTLQTNRTWNHF